MRPNFEKRWNRFARPAGRSWRVDETYVKIKGRWTYLYRAVGAVTPTWIGAARGLEGRLNFRPRWRLATSGTLRLLGREAYGGK